MMDKLLKLFTLFLFSAFVACETAPSSQNDPVTTNGDSTSQQGSNGQTTVPVAPPPVKPECEVAGSVLDENSFWAKTGNQIVVLVADKETEDPELGESHRVLEVYDKNCQRIYRHILPINFSPDFPYYLSDITYNNVSQVIAIRGFDKVYIFNLVNKNLSEPLSPIFLNKRYEEDAQSGMIQRLEVWEDFLIGYATNKGTFVFDLENPMNAQPVMPTAEFEITKGIDYNSLFFLESGGKNNGFQALLPDFNMDTGEFDVNPLFEKPLHIETNLNRNFRNNRFLVIKELLGGTENKPIGIDMRALKKYDIPSNIASKKDTEIIDWMKKQ